MDENKLNESSFRRARHDFVGVRHKIWYFGAVELVMSSAGLFIGNLIVPDQASNFVTAGYPVAGAIIGSCHGFNKMMEDSVTKENYDIVMAMDPSEGDFSVDDRYLPRQVEKVAKDLVSIFN